MTNKMILCEGPCSLAVSMSVIEELEAGMVYGQSAEEKNRAVRASVTARLKLTEHKFERPIHTALSESVSFFFSCVSCGQGRIYGKVRGLCPELRDLYSLYSKGA